MHLMKKILIPTDFSDKARKALDYALAWFSDISVDFYILHVSPPKKDESFYDETYVLTQKPEPSTSVLRRLKKEIEYCEKRSLNPGHRFIPVSHERSLIGAMRYLVYEEKIDFIFMSTRGGSKTHREGVGSKTYEVISKVKCPIFIIPEGARYEHFKNIALVTDYNNWEKERMFIGLYETLLTKQARLHILEIKNKDRGLSPHQMETKNFLMDLLKNVESDFKTLAASHIDQEIQQSIDELAIDLIVIVGRNINFVRRLLFRPDSAKVSYQFKTPFLVLHE